MRIIGLILIATLTFTSCSLHKKAATTYDVPTEEAQKRRGASFDDAVFINEKSEMTGISAEYKWLAENYPGYKTKSQSLKSNGNRIYDIIEIETATGATVEVYFDISKFYGKF